MRNRFGTLQSPINKSIYLSTVTDISPSSKSHHQWRPFSKRSIALHQCPPLQRHFAPPQPAFRLQRNFGCQNQFCSLRSIIQQSKFQQSQTQNINFQPNPLNKHRAKTYNNDYYFETSRSPNLHSMNFSIPLFPEYNYNCPDQILSIQISPDI